MKAFTFLQQTRFIKGLRVFHEDEDGMEAIQVVMIIAIAGLVLIALAAFGDKIFEWLRKVGEEVFGIRFD